MLSRPFPFLIFRLYARCDVRHFVDVFAQRNKLPGAVIIVKFVSRRHGVIMLSLRHLGFCFGRECGNRSSTNQRPSYNGRKQRAANERPRCAALQETRAVIGWVAAWGNPQRQRTGRAVLRKSQNTKGRDRNCALQPETPDQQGFIMQINCFPELKPPGNSKKTTHQLLEQNGPVRLMPKEDARWRR